MTIVSKLQISKYGNPTEELALVTEPWAPVIEKHEAHIRTLYSPVHPADFLTIQGAFPMNFPMPLIPGSESVVEVISGNKLAEGDIAIPLKPDWCHWLQEGIIEEDGLFKVPKELPLEVAATLTINPTTAYALLKDIVPLQPGDVVIQNGANSACGQVIIQLAKAAGIRTVNVIRNRPNLSEVVKQLKDLGADAVITTEELSKGLANLDLGLPTPKLALECVGGRAAMDLASTLSPGGTLVVYGILSGEPAQFDQLAVIMRNINIIGFTLFRYRMEHGPQHFAQLLNDLISLYLDGKLSMPQIRKFHVSDWRTAVCHAQKSYINEKVLLQFN